MSKYSNLVCSEQDLRRHYKDDVLGVHGTSVEAVIALFEKGKLTRESFSRQFHCTDKSGRDFLYFIPNVASYDKYFLQRGIDARGLLIADVYGDTEHATWDKVIDEAEFWARTIGFRHYVLNTLGFDGVIWASDLRDEVEDNLLASEVVPELLREYPVFKRFLNSQGITHQQFWSILEDGCLRNGCYLAIDKSAQELDIDQPPEDYNNIEARVHAPEGLNIKYIKAIVPLGILERRIIRNYFGF